MGQPRCGKTRIMAEKWHVRRCHMCGEITEVQGQLLSECAHCGKHLSPFYYFNEKLAMSLITLEQASREYKSSALPHAEYPPIFGLTAYWDSQ